MSVTAGTVVGLLAGGRSRAEIIEAYPYIEEEDIDQCLAYAAWRLEENEVPLYAPRRAARAHLGIPGPSAIRTMNHAG